MALSREFWDNLTVHQSYRNIKEWKKNIQNYETKTCTFKYINKQYTFPIPTTATWLADTYQNHLLPRVKHFQEFRSYPIKNRYIRKIITLNKNDRIYLVLIENLTDSQINLQEYIWKCTQIRNKKLYLFITYIGMFSGETKQDIYHHLKNWRILKIGIARFCTTHIGVNDSLQFFVA